MAIQDGHRVILEFDDGLHAKLVCPASGCVPGEICGLCGRSVHETDPEAPPCYDCKDGPGESSRECWIKGWFDNLTPEELLHGTIEFPITAEWDCDTLVAHIVDPAHQSLGRAA